MKFIKYAVHDHLAYITLNRPEKSNALCYELISELRVAFRSAEDDGEVKAIILKATGDAFCAGLVSADLSIEKDRDRAGACARARRGLRACYGL